MKKRFTRIGFASVTLLVCLSLIWLVVRGGSSPNQSPHLPSVPMPTPPGKEAFTGEISPYDIRNFVLGKSESDITSLWDRLEIKTMNVSEHQQLDPQNFQFLTDCTNCEAEVFHHELDGQPGAEAIVRVRDQSSQATRYLIFTELDEPVGDWKFIGHIDSDFNKYREAQHSIVASRGGPLLVITSQGASGSGVALYGSRVFLTKPTGLREVLYHTTEGSQAGHFNDPSRVFFGHIVSAELDGETVNVEVAFSVKYFIPDYSNQMAGVHLFTKTQKAVFTRTPESKRARLDRERSELSEQELEDVYNIDSLTGEAFLVYNFEELARVAAGDDGVKKEWLRRFLTECDKTPERDRLLGIL